jgi:hypothetical protein
MNTVDFLTRLGAGENRLYEILKIEKAGNDLNLVLGCSDGASVSKCVHFRQVSDFEHTLFGGPEDSDQLPQTLIGLDYWSGSNELETYNWELNGDECRWNFRAPLPNVDDR